MPACSSDSPQPRCFTGCLLYQEALNLIINTTPLKLASLVCETQRSCQVSLLGNDFVDSDETRSCYRAFAGGASPGSFDAALSTVKLPLLDLTGGTYVDIPRTVGVQLLNSLRPLFNFDALSLSSSLVVTERAQWSKTRPITIDVQPAFPLTSRTLISSRVMPPLVRPPSIVCFFLFVLAHIFNLRVVYYDAS